MRTEEEIKDFILQFQPNIKTILNFEDRTSITIDVLRWVLNDDEWFNKQL